MLDLLTALVDRSVLAAQPDPEATRFRMLETVREYAAERLADAGEAAAARRAHAAWYRRLVETAPPAGGADHELWLRRFDAEQDNLRAALDWSLGEGADPGTALVVAGRGWWYWWVTGQMAEGRRWLGRALAAAGTPPTRRPGRRRGERRAARGRRAGPQQRRPRRRAAARRTLPGRLPGGRRRRPGSPPRSTGCPSPARPSPTTPPRCGTGRRAWRPPGGPGTGAARRSPRTRSPARCAAWAGWRRRRHCSRTALETFREAGDRRGEAAALTNLAIVARRRGDEAGSRRLVLAGLAGYRELELVEGELDLLEEWACLEAADRPAAALRLLVLADRERRRLGAPVFTPDEVADRATARARARAALSAGQVEAVTAEAMAADLDTAVAELLERA